MRPSMRNAAAFASLLSIQTLGMAYLLWTVFPVFHEVMTHLGEPQQISRSTYASILFCTLFFQVCYWSRVLWVAVRVPFNNVVAHLISFVARLSFLFGGAFFSTIFFRHLPELGALPPLGRAILSGVSIAAVLFGLYCYSLELERFGRAIDEEEQDEDSQIRDRRRPPRQRADL